MILMLSEQPDERSMSVEDQIALVRHEQEELEKRVALIEDMLAAIRSEDDVQ
jgi:hypothetical protein